MASVYDIHCVGEFPVSIIRLPFDVLLMYWGLAMGGILRVLYVVYEKRE